jgi:membrane protein implicated in regulation of membrane protease activity
METETFFSLLKNPAHWEFELFLMFVFDVVLGMLLLPWFRKATNHHENDDKKIENLEKQVKVIQDLLNAQGKQT